MGPRARELSAASVVTLGILAYLVAYADDLLFMWYVVVRDVVYLRAALYPVSALMLSAVSIAAFQSWLDHSTSVPGARRLALGLARVAIAALVLGGAVYLAEAVARVGTLFRRDAWFGAGLAGLTVGAWVSVSVATWVAVLYGIQGARRCGRSVLLKRGLKTATPNNALKLTSGR